MTDKNTDCDTIKCTHFDKSSKFNCRWVSFTEDCKDYKPSKAKEFRDTEGGSE